MRIVWLDAELDEAMLVRGRWWWKRCAVVYREKVIPITGGTIEIIKWRFRNSDFDVSNELFQRLETERQAQREAGHDDIDWSPMPSRPKRVSRPNLRLLPSPRATRIGGGE